MNKGDDRKGEEKSINELISKSKKQSKELSDVIERVSKSNSAVAMGGTSFNPFNQTILNQILNSHRSLNEANTKLLERSKGLKSLKKGIYILIGEVSVIIAVFIATFIATTL